MAGDNFTAGLTDQDELSQYPSAANPLTALGIDPDEARANPSLLAALNPNAAPPASTPPPTVPGGVAMPGSDPAPPSTSASTAGELGGAGDAPATATPATATDYGMAGLGSLKQNADLATQAVQQIPTSSPVVDRLTEQRKQFAAPAPLYDEQSGKMLGQTTEVDPKTGQPVTIDPKPTVGTRIWRGVRGGLTGLLTSGIRGGLLGAIDPAMEGSQAYGAPDAAYQKAEQQREGALASTDQQISSARDNWKAAVDAAKARATEFRANAGLGKDLTTGSTGMQNAATDASKVPILKEEADAHAQEAQNNSPQSKADLSQKELDQRTQQADRLRLSPLNRQLYILNGKVPDPRAPTEGEITAAAVVKAQAALNLSKGLPANTPLSSLDDYNQVQAAARGQLARSEKTTGTQMLVPDGKGGMVAKMIQPGDPVPAGSTLMNGKSSTAPTGPVATVADKNRASLAHVANDNLDQIEDIINRHPGIVGSGGGRVSSVAQMLGSNDPDLVALGNAVHNFAMANAGIHGSRSHENVVDAENALINNMKTGVEGIRGGIKENRQNLKAIIDRVEGPPKSADSSHDIVVKPEDM